MGTPLYWWQWCGVNVTVTDTYSYVVTAARLILIHCVDTVSWLWPCFFSYHNPMMFFWSRRKQGPVFRDWIFEFLSIVVNEICTKNYVRANVWVIVYTYIVNNDSWQAAKQQLWDSSNRVRLFDHCPFKRWLWTLKTVYCVSFIANDVLGWALSCDKTKRSP